MYGFHSESTESHSHSLSGPMKTLDLQSDHVLTGCSAGHIVDIVYTMRIYYIRIVYTPYLAVCVLFQHTEISQAVKHWSQDVHSLSLQHGPAYIVVMALIQTLIRAKC